MQKLKCNTLFTIIMHNALGNAYYPGRAELQLFEYVCVLAVSKEHLPKIKYYCLPKYLLLKCDFSLQFRVCVGGGKWLLKYSFSPQFFKYFLFHKILSRSFCQSYDMKQHSTKVFRDIVNALGSFIQSLFLVPSTGNASATPNQTGKALSLLLFYFSIVFL